LLISTILLFTFHCYSKTFLKHQVKDGESLSVIGGKYGVSMEQIRAANNLKKNVPLIKGTVLNIPVKEDLDIHIVGEGENLFRIGLKHNITVNRLCKINGFSENVKLFAGMKILVPKAENDTKVVTAS
jgi:LysM repeat protein